MLLDNFGKVLVFGKNGQVGSELKRLLKADVIAVDQKDLDLADLSQINEFLKKIEPRLVINAAAYTNVDLAERHCSEAFDINAKAPIEIARWAQERDVPFVHFSTDYVYDGSGDKPHREDDIKNPLNIYAKSKLEGDDGIVALGGRFLIFRTSWVYSEDGKNFLNTILRLAKEKSELKIVSDQVGAPTYAKDLASAVIKALQLALASKKFPAGVYNLCNAGFTSWYEFALQITTEAKIYSQDVLAKKVTSISASEYLTPAKRPNNSRLDLTKFNNTFGFEMPEWKDALKRCVRTKYEGH